MAHSLLLLRRCSWLPKAIQASMAMERGERGRADGERRRAAGWAAEDEAAWRPPARRGPGGVRERRRWGRGATRSGTHEAGGWP